MFQKLIERYGNGHLTFSAVNSRGFYSNFINMMQNCIIHFFE